MPFKQKYATEEERKAARKASQNAAIKRYRERNIERVRQWRRNAHARHRVAYNESNRAYKLKYSYGISEEDYDAMLSYQNGVCAICDGVNPSGRRLAVDHCHTTGKVRGLLCSKCNTLLGHAGDDVDILTKSISYLAVHK